jgi:hypothetical protein
MCLFSRNVRFVGATRIFARREGARQFLAYAMNVEMDEALAMVLPLPVPPFAREDAVEFVDLQGYANFFDDVARAFPVAIAGAYIQSLSREPVPRALVVHDVGDFVASFVPRRKDFARLDPRFRLDDGVFDRLPQYADWGFAVFQLKPTKHRQNVHPMAFSFPMHEERSLFFPTVHVHHGRVEPEAHFDHTLYAQTGGVLGAALAWTRSADRLGAFVDAERARGIVDGGAIGFQQPMFGSLTNDDVWLREPEGIALEDLHGRGECFEYALGAMFAHAHGKLPANIERWRSTAQHRLGAVSRALRDGLPALVHAKRAAWRLAPITPDMPLHFMNGDQLWSGTDYMNGKPNAKRGVRGVVTFSPFTERVHTQTVRLGFDAIPEDDVVGDIRRTLSEILENA